MRSPEVPRAQSVIKYSAAVGGADGKAQAEPFGEAAIAKLAGGCAFGVTPAGRIGITVAKMQLRFGRPGRCPRGRFRLGGFEFGPMRAAAVRVKFAESAGAMLVTVHDPDVVLTARGCRRY